MALQQRTAHGFTLIQRKAGGPALPGNSVHSLTWFGYLKNEPCRHGTFLLSHKGRETNSYCNLLLNLLTHPNHSESLMENPGRCAAVFGQGTMPTVYLVDISLISALKQWSHPKINSDCNPDWTLPDLEKGYWKVMKLSNRKQHFKKLEYLSKRSLQKLPKKQHSHTVPRRGEKKVEILFEELRAEVFTSVGKETNIRTLKAPRGWCRWGWEAHTKTYSDQIR